jgi:hypothetical protein
MKISLAQIKFFHHSKQKGSQGSVAQTGKKVHETPISTKSLVQLHVPVIPSFTRG